MKSRPTPPDPLTPSPNPLRTPQVRRVNAGLTRAVIPVPQPSTIRTRPQSHRAPSDRTPQFERTEVGSAGILPAKRFFHPATKLWAFGRFAFERTSPKITVIRMSTTKSSLTNHKIHAKLWNVVAAHSRNFLLHIAIASPHPQPFLPLAASRKRTFPNFNLPSDLQTSSKRGGVYPIPSRIGTKLIAASCPAAARQPKIFSFFFEDAAKENFRPGTS